MYVIHITVNSDVSEKQRAEMFPFHAEWLQKYFREGKFLILGPKVNTNAHAGIILAQSDSIEELHSILNEDCFYPDYAQYAIHEFLPKFISAGIDKFVGQ